MIGRPLQEKIQASQTMKIATKKEKNYHIEDLGYHITPGPARAKLKR